MQTVNVSTTTDDVLDALADALSTELQLAALGEAVERNAALPSRMLEATSGGQFFASLHDGEVRTDDVLIGAREEDGGNAYELTARPQLDLVVSDPDPETREATFRSGLIAADEAARRLTAAVADEKHPLHAVLSDVAIESIDRSNHVLAGVPLIRAAVVTFAATFTSSRPF